MRHLYGVFDRRTVAFEHRSRRRAGDRRHFQVKLGREPPIQSQLFLAVEFAFFQIGEIHKPQIDRLLHFVDMLPH